MSEKKDKKTSDEQAAAAESATANGAAESESAEAAEASAEQRNDGDQGSEASDDTGTTNAPADPLEAAQLEAKENYDRFVRARAELENARKRFERDRVDLSKYASEALARDLLVVVDDLERALEHGADGGEGLAEGVKLVLDSMLSALEKHGIRRIDASGQPFDPAVHEAVAMIETSDHDENTVIDEHRAGYMLSDRLLRASMVAVAKAPAGAAAEPAGNSEKE